MKKILMLVFFVVPIGIVAYSQDLDSAVATAISKQIKDSFQLDDDKSRQLFRIEMMVRKQKREIREQYRNTPKLQPLMREQDMRRDSLIRTVIGDEQFVRFRERKARAFMGN